MTCCTHRDEQIDWSRFRDRPDPCLTRFTHNPKHPFQRAEMVRPQPHTQSHSRRRPTPTLTLPPLAGREQEQGGGRWQTQNLQAHRVHARGHLAHERALRPLGERERLYTTRLRGVRWRSHKHFFHWTRLQAPRAGTLAPPCAHSGCVTPSRCVVFPCLCMTPTT